MFNSTQWMWCVIMNCQSLVLIKIHTGPDLKNVDIFIHFFKPPGSFFADRILIFIQYFRCLHLSSCLCFRPPVCIHRRLRQQLVRRPYGCRAPVLGQRQPRPDHGHMDRVRLALFFLCSIVSLSRARSKNIPSFLSRMSGSLPDTVTVEDNRLTVKKVDNAVNTTFVCEVKNKHGASSNQITTFVIG